VIGGAADDAPCDGACVPGADGIDGCGDDGGANGDMRGGTGGAAGGAAAGAGAADADGAGAGTTGMRVGVSRDCAPNPACIGCGGVGIETGGRGGSGAETDGRWRAGVCAVCGEGADAVKSSSIRPRSPMAITPPHTEQRARTPASGIFAGSTRNTELHSGQVTFMRWRSRESCSLHRSETPTGEPRIGSCRRSTT
jgi:hypothetical protein